MVDKFSNQIFHFSIFIYEMRYGWKIWWDGMRKWERVEKLMRFLKISLLLPKLSISSIKSSLSISIVGSSKIRWVEMKDDDGWLWDDDGGWLWWDGGWLWWWLFSKLVEYLNSNLLIIR